MSIFKKDPSFDLEEYLLKRANLQLTTNKACAIIYELILLEGVAQLVRVLA